MPSQDKALLMNKVEETLKPRMFANMLDEAVDEIQEHLDEFDITHIGTLPLKPDDMLESFINAKHVAGRSEKTLVRYRYVINRFMAFCGVSTRDVTPQHVRAYFAHEIERGVSLSTVDGLRETLHGYFAWLVADHLIVRNPLLNIEAIKYQKKERLSLSNSDVELLKRNAGSIRNNAIISFLLATGCRVGEIVGLNKKDVKLNAAECIVLGKGNKERTVFLDDVAVLTLREYLRSRHDRNPALFVNRNGERLSAGGIRAMLNKIAAASDLENVHPHRFRRTAVTNLLNRGMPIQEVAILVGHEKVDTTMKYFSSDKTRLKNSYMMYST